MKPGTVYAYKLHAYKKNMYSNKPLSAQYLRDNAARFHKDQALMNQSEK